MKPKILVVDDSRHFLKTLVLELSRHFEVDACFTVSEAKRTLSKDSGYMAAVVDLFFEGQKDNGLALLKVLAIYHPRTKVIVMTGSTDAGLIIKAAKQTYYDLFHKDLDLFKKLERELLKIAAHNIHDDDPIISYPTESPKIKALLNDAERILRHPRNASILVTGETGSGKERFVQYLAARLKKRVVAVNMANVQKETGESVLFGHEKELLLGRFSVK